MGLVQKVFYFHFPSAILFLTAGIVCGVNSARFLFFKKASADSWAMAAAELGFVFGALTLVTGPLWARKAWGVWWVWDTRLTMSLVSWLIFGGYMLLRRYGGPGSDKLGAGLALFGMANVPFIYISVNVWRTLHPKTSVVPTLPTDMGVPLWFCFAAFTMLFVALLRMRATLELQRARVEALYLEDER
jgi:heme exporter protein C